MVTALDLVAFDMAGTTIDDHGLVYDALRDSVIEAGATLLEADLQTWMGTDKLTAIGALLRLGGGDPTQIQATFERFRVILAKSYLLNPPVALPGVADTLAELQARGIRTSLTTGFSDDVALPMLESLGLKIGPDELLNAVITTSDVPAGRPAPYLIHQAMRATGSVDVRRVLAAGDTLVDLAAAKNAGVIAVGVLTGALGRGELSAEPHDYILDGVADVLGLREAALY